MNDASCNSEDPALQEWLKENITFHRRLIERAMESVDKQIVVCILTQDLPEFEELKRRIHRLNILEQRLSEIESDELNQLLFAAAPEDSHRFVV